MPSYDIFGKFYDAVMGDRAEATKRLRGFIRKANPEAKNVLELACGTGSVLKHLSKHYDVWGLDLSGTSGSLSAFGKIDTCCTKKIFRRCPSRWARLFMP